MAWKIIFTGKAQKQINHLDKTIQSRIKKAILTKLIINPLAHLEPLVGEFGGYYKFRIGDYRLICTKEEKELVVIVVEIGHRSAVYKT